MSSVSLWIKQRLLWRYPHFQKFLPNCYLPFPFAGGWIYIKLKQHQMSLQRALGLYEVETREAIRHFIKPGMTFIDVGANKGDYSLIAARLTGPAGRVIAFEPFPDNCSWIRKNQRLNGYRNIELRQEALGEADGQTQLFVGKEPGWNTLIPDKETCTGEALNVTKRRLDSVLADLGNPPVHGIKIDVEGAELSVLQGAAQTLCNNRDVVLFMDLHPHLGVNPLVVCDFLKRMDFAIFSQKAPCDEPLTPFPGLRSLLARRVF
jgi:FkbM family methyltransferase